MGNSAPKRQVTAHNMHSQHIRHAKACLFFLIQSPVTKKPDKLRTKPWWFSLVTCAVRSWFLTALQ